MIFLCGRPSCGDESTATLQIDAIAESVTLVDPRISRDGVPLCSRHADSTTPPVGWTMNDLRSTYRALADPEQDGENVAVGSKPPRVRPGSEIRDRPGQRMSSRQSIEARALNGASAAEPDSADPADEVGDEPGADADVIDLNASSSRSSRNKQPPGSGGLASRPSRRREATADESSAEDVFPWHYEFDDEDEPEELQASSPLLSRAFRSATGR